MPSAVDEYLISNFPLFKAILDAGRPFIVNDVRTTGLLDEALRQLCMRLQTISFINIPVIKNNKPVGLLSIVQSKPRKWTDSEVQLTIQTAERTWAAIERANAEEALRKREEKYRTLFESINEGFCIMELVYDEKGNVQDLIFREQNPSFYKHTGLGDVRGHSLKKVLPHYEKYWIDMYRQVAETGESIHTENYAQDIDRWYKVEFLRVGNPESKLVATIFEDVTERKNAEQQQAFLSEISKDLVELQNINETIELLGEKIAKYFKASWCTFTELTDSQETCITNSGWSAPGFASLKGSYKVRDFLTVEQIRKNNAGELTIVNDIQNYPGINPETYAALNIQSFIGVPFTRNNKLDS